ncbi:LysE family transporter [Rhizobium sp.]|uniref:LysE/ArgO family amino acid transporter n=1 Tax=Rhizobium sp. TaxID=391 RepID=UPI0028A9F018
MNDFRNLGTTLTLREKNTGSLCRITATDADCNGKRGGFGVSGSYILSAGGTGFVFGTSLIFSIGPQNLYLIRAGALTKAPLLIATVGYLSEFLLVTAGLVSVGAVIRIAPVVDDMLRLLGIGFLLWCGLSSLLKRRTDALSQTVGVTTTTRALSSMLAVTWLNPLVYIEIVFLTGAMAASFEPELRLWFAAGFLAASSLRFYGWTLMGRLLQHWLASPRNQRLFDIAAGLFLIASAALLVRQLYLFRN